jgi:pyruvate formate lyase activating enzyme
MDTAKACHELGLKTVAVTAGYIMPEARKEFYSVIDAANVDLKAFTDLFYQHVTLSRLEPILDTLRWLKEETDVWFEITNLVIPGKNDSPDEIARMSEWIVTNLGPDVPLHFTAFHPDFKMQDIPATPAETLIRARKQALSAGLNFVYTGNIFDHSTQSTYCPSCNACLIERDWFKLGLYAIKDGCCEFCGSHIPGVFQARKGNWGPRRMPLSFK